jgi:hypothetical protein
MHGFSKGDWREVAISKLHAVVASFCDRCQIARGWLTSRIHQIVLRYPETHRLFKRLFGIPSAINPPTPRSSSVRLRVDLAHQHRARPVSRTLVLDRAAPVTFGRRPATPPDSPRAGTD